MDYIDDCFGLLEIPAIITGNAKDDQEELETMQQCNDALHRLIIPALEKDLRGDDSSIVLLNDFFDEIECYGIDPVNYIHFVHEQINFLCLGKK